MAHVDKRYVAPITLGFTPSDGDIIEGTINGVNVGGYWFRGAAGLDNDSGTNICDIGLLDGRAVVMVYQDSAPTTDYELHLYRHVPAGIVQIPQRYVDGLEETTANANQALETATAAQNTANTAKSTADTAQNTANTAKSTADTAQNTANTAKSTADTAKTTAETAQSTANAAKTTAETAQSTANAAKTTANAAAPKENPEFTGTFSQNREPGSDIGNNSHAEGSNTTASGDNSHAEGFNTTASGNTSHAEGFYTTASGNTSHAEGTSTTASGDNSHAEGFNTTASGNTSHAEGLNTTAGGACSHAEGDHTIASNGHVHVQGMYNLEDTAGRYLHIVGNGDSNARSNAHTIDMKGVPWYQGRPQFGGNAMNDGAKTVVGNGDQEIILSSSTPDSTKKFKITVDDTGTISATEVT